MKNDLLVLIEDNTSSSAVNHFLLQIPSPKICVTQD